MVRDLSKVSEPRSNRERIQTQALDCSGLYTTRAQEHTFPIAHTGKLRPERAAAWRRIEDSKLRGQSPNPEASGFRTSHMKPQGLVSGLYSSL